MQSVNNKGGKKEKKKKLPETFLYYPTIPQKILPSAAQVHASVISFQQFHSLASAFVPTRENKKTNLFSKEET